MTHSKQEAFAFADTLAFMEAGKIVQTGTAESLYLQPCSAALAESMGEGNWFDVEVIGSSSTSSIELGKIESIQPHGLAMGLEVRQFIRPNQLAFSVKKSGQGKVLEQVFNGEHHICTIAIGNRTLLVSQPLSEKIAVGAKVAVSVLPHKSILFERNT